MSLFSADKLASYFGNQNAHSDYCNEFKHRSSVSKCMQHCSMMMKEYVQCTQYVEHADLTICVARSPVLAVTRSVFGFVLFVLLPAGNYPCERKSSRPTLFGTIVSRLPTTPLGPAVNTFVKRPHCAGAAGLFLRLRRENGSLPLTPVRLRRLAFHAC